MVDYIEEDLARSHALVDEHMHVPVNVFAESGTDLSYLYSTWFCWREPGMDDILEGAEDALAVMFEKFQAEPVTIKGTPTIFLARYEFPKFMADFRHPDGVFNEEAIGFADFLAGFPFDCIETLGLVREIYDTPEDIPTKERTWEPVPFLPKDRHFFGGFKGYVANYKGAETGDYDCRPWAKTLEDTPVPTDIHFWMRLNIDGELPFPTPGEFVAMCCRLFPNMPWGTQKTHPYVFSGNWFDTVFYSCAEILWGSTPTDDVPYSTLMVRRRNETVDGILPTDFAEYLPGDRVTVLKDPLPSVASVTWEDDKKFLPEWKMAPVVFYQT